MAEIIWDVWAADREIRVLKERQAWLETVAAAISRKCRDRDMVRCDLDCRGRQFCNTEGLNPYSSCDELGMLVVERIRVGWELDMKKKEETCAG